jgi:glutathione reductase (NADPH)
LQRVDLAVVGSGVAAGIVARRCRAAGWSVVVIEKRPLGGTCALRGCDPKKVLRRGAEIVEAARLLRGRGITGEVAIGWPELMAFKRGFTDPVPAARERSVARQGIGVVKGHARFVDETTLAIDGREYVQAQRIVLAVGASPAPLGFDGAQHVITSDDFLELDQLPRRVMFIGGGYVSFELAHLAARAGAEVTIVDRGERPLKAFEPELVELLLDRTRGLGVAFHAGGTVQRVVRNGGGLRAELLIRGRSQATYCDLIVHGAGRSAAIDCLDLSRAEVKASAKGIEVDRFLRSTSNRAVYAAGDAAAGGGPPLTPVASLEAEVVAANLLEGDHLEPDYTGVPSAVFTLPELVRIGLSEAAAREQGFDVETRFSDMREWYSVRRTGETHAAAKMLIDRSSGRLLGAHLLGPEASEVANVLGLAMRESVPVERLQNFVSAYPSAGSDIASLV